MRRKILISGTSGLLGSALCPHLEQAGYEVWRLVRHTSLKPQEVFWNPDSAILNPDQLEDFHSIIHLAGENISAKRWTSHQKKYLLHNRTQSSNLLHNTIRKLNKPPNSLIIASAVGFYGNRSTSCTEKNGPGTNFSSQLCQAIERANSLKIRVVYSRFGVILSPNGGALPKLLPAFKYGLGGALGSGQQMFSWITLEDTVRALLFILENDNLVGAVNVTSPNPVTNQVLTQSLAGALGQTAKFPLPAWVVRLLFGQMGQELLLEGVAAQPTKLQAAGFSFNQPNVQQALASLLNHTIKR